MQISEIISLGSLGFAILMGIIALRRDNKKDDSEDAAKMATVLIKLETINTGISDLKSEVSNIKVDLKEDHDSNLIHDQSLKSAWKQIDEINVILGRKNRSGMDERSN